MTRADELEIPEAALRDPTSVEVLRLWIANRDQHLSLRCDAEEDPAAWGIMVSDLMHHVANAYHQNEGRDWLSVFQRIKAGLESQMASLMAPPNE